MGRQTGPRHTVPVTTPGLAMDNLTKLATGHNLCVSESFLRLVGLTALVLLGHQDSELRHPGAGRD